MGRYLEVYIYLFPTAYMGRYWEYLQSNQILFVVYIYSIQFFWILWKIVKHVRLSLVSTDRQVQKYCYKLFVYEL